MANPQSQESSTRSWFDNWPENFDGTGLYDKIIARTGLGFRFDVDHLIRLIQEKVGFKVVDVPKVYNGSNYFGFHFHLDSGLDILARIFRSDVNLPNYEGFPYKTLRREAEFEAAIYQFLLLNPKIPISPLLFYRLPVLRTLEKEGTSISIDEGRALFIFARTEGEKNVWQGLEPGEKSKLFVKLAEIRVSLFRCEIPLGFAKSWLLDRHPNPANIVAEIAPTRTFTAALLMAKVEDVIKNEGDPIGWESDHAFAGPIAVAAKQSLLRLIPLILPADESLYRFVLEHGDYGIHNMSIIPEVQTVTSLYDWETGHIVPAILSDPEVAVAVDIGIDCEGAAVVSRIPNAASEKELSKYTQWGITYAEVPYLFCHLNAKPDYLQAISERAPEYIRAIKVGKDARHIWMAFKAWRGEDAEGYFGALGSWAEGRLKDLSPE